jgi:hypothetical protein
VFTVTGQQSTHTHSIAPMSLNSVTCAGIHGEKLWGPCSYEAHALTGDCPGEREGQVGSSVKRQEPGLVVQPSGRVLAWHA